MTQILLQVPLAVGQVERGQPRRILLPPVSENVGVSCSARERHQQLRRGRRNGQRRFASQMPAQMSTERSPRLGTLLTKLTRFVVVKNCNVQQANELD